MIPIQLLVWALRVSAIKDPDQPMVILATAHPAKFPTAIEKADINISATVPAHMSDLFEREERFTVLSNDKASELINS